jgi:hypothetical protein
LLVDAPEVVVAVAVELAVADDSEPLPVVLLPETVEPAAVELLARDEAVEPALDDAFELVAAPPLLPLHATAARHVPASQIFQVMSAPKYG